MNRRIIYFLFILFFYHSSKSQLVPVSEADSIAGHTAIHDKADGVLSWYEPGVPGAGYDHVVRLASEFMKDKVPADPVTGEKLYFVTCCFQGPHMQDNPEAINGILPEDWMHNPACIFAGCVHSLAMGYRVYSGERSYLHLVSTMLDYQLDHGTTPEGWEWENVPYASADPFEREYHGATRWERDGMRGDGLHGIEPDKVGELGYAYLLFYEISGVEKYLTAAVHCADALADHVRDVLNDPSPFALTETNRSPWPFRLNARNGIIIDEYCSNVVEPVKLFDELIRISGRIGLGEDKIAGYQRARDLAWNWLFSRNGPIVTGVWNGYFEDIPNDPGQSNRVQITPMETARYIIRHPELDTDIGKNVPALIQWVRSAFRTDGMDAIKEQTWCYEPMGSHTARYGSICALWYEFSGDPWYKEEARKYLNLATYMTDENGVVRVGPNWHGSWFSDGYGDYIRHFIDALGAVPEWVPDDTDHLVRSSTAIKDISYTDEEIGYVTFDAGSDEVLRLSSKPSAVEVDGKILQQKKEPGIDGWYWQKNGKGGILRIYKKGHDVVIRK